MKAFTRLVIAAVGAAAFFSCTQNGGLIYLNVQKTTKTNTSNSIPLDITAADIININATGGSSPAPYYLAAGKIYNGSISTPGGSTNWNAISVPQAGGKDMLCNALSYDSIGNKLWGGFFSGDGGTAGLFTATPGINVWTPAAPADTLVAANTQVAYINAIPNGGSTDVFVVWAVWSNSAYNYQLDWLHAGTWTTLVPTSVAGLNIITGIAYVSTSNTYLMTFGNTLYTTSGSVYPSLAFVPAALQPAPSYTSDRFQGVFVDTNYLGTGQTFIAIPSSNPTTSTTGYGNLYYSINGGSTWIDVTAAVGSYNVGFLCVSGPIDAARTTYLIGSDSGTGGAFGFYILTPQGTNVFSLNRFQGISYTLYYSAVRRIMVDIPNNLVAMGTINNGLWVTTPIDTSTNYFFNNTWTQE